MGCSASSSAALGNSDASTAKDCSQVMSRLASKEAAAVRGNKATVYNRGIHVPEKSTKECKQTNHFQIESAPRMDKKDSIESAKSLSTRDRLPQTCYSPDLAKESTHMQLLVAPANRPGTPQRNNAPCHNSNITSREDRSETIVSSLPPVEETLPPPNRPQSVLSSKTSDDVFKNQTNAVKSNTSHQTELNNSQEYWKAPTVSHFTIQPLPPVFSKIESKSIIFIEQTTDAKLSDDAKISPVCDDMKSNATTTISPKKNHKMTKKNASPLETDHRVSFDNSADSAVPNNRRNIHNIRRHSHHYHHHHRKLSVTNCSRTITPEKTLKITTKDERAQFVFKTVKSRNDLENGSGDTRDILIQTDVFSLNDNNEKTKKKLLIKIGKFGSKSSPACIPAARQTKGVEEPKNPTSQEHTEAQREQDIATDVRADWEEVSYPQF
ncbi:hypothetical protein BsWGS_25031 [Bradybaena similaris]